MLEKERVKKTEAAIRGVLCKKVLLEISQNSREKPVPESLFLIKKRLWHRYFPVNFVKFLRTPFLHNTSGRLLLKKENRKNSRNKSKQRTFYFSFS